MHTGRADVPLANFPSPRSSAQRTNVERHTKGLDGFLETFPNASKDEIIDKVESSPLLPLKDLTATPTTTQTTKTSHIKYINPLRLYRSRKTSKEPKPLTTTTNNLRTNKVFFSHRPQRRKHPRWSSSRKITKTIQRSSTSTSRSYSSSN
jgi:hypothetical protein